MYTAADITRFWAKVDYFDNLADAAAKASELRKSLHG